MFSLCFITIRNLLASMPKSASTMWPTRWKSVGYNNQNLDEGILTINRFEHDTSDVDRFSERVVDKDVEDVAIKERDPLPPIFVSQNFHHSGVGKSCLKSRIHFNIDTKLAWVLASVRAGTHIKVNNKAFSIYMYWHSRLFNEKRRKTSSLESFPWLRKSCEGGWKLFWAGRGYEKRSMQALQ